MMICGVWARCVRLIMNILCWTEDLANRGVKEDRAPEGTYTQSQCLEALPCLIVWASACNECIDELLCVKTVWNALDDTWAQTELWESYSGSASCYILSKTCCARCERWRRCEWLFYSLSSVRWVFWISGEKFFLLHRDSRLLLHLSSTASWCSSDSERTDGHLVSGLTLKYFSSALL